MSTPAQRSRLGQRILKQRQAKGWTLAQLQEATGIDKSALSRIERGERAPELATLRKLRDAFTLTDDEFLSWVDAA